MNQKRVNFFRVAEILELRDIVSVIRQAALVLGCLIVVSGLLYISTKEPAWLIFCRNSLTGFCISLLLLQLARLGQTKLAAYATLILFGVWLLSIAWDGAGVRGVTYTMLVLVVVSAGLFIGKRAGYWAALLITICGVLLMLANRAGLLTNVERPTTDLAAFILTSVTFFITAHIIRLSIDQVDRALKKAENEINERELAEEEIRRLNLSLEQRVKERTEELVASREQYRQRANEMSLLYRLGNTLASGQDLNQTLQTLWQEIDQQIPADAFYVAIYDATTDIVSYPIFFYRGVTSTEASPSRQLSSDPGLTGAVIFGKKTIYLPDMYTEAVKTTYAPVDDNDYDLSTFLGIPLISKDRVIGMLSVQTQQKNAYSSEQIQLIENIALQAGLAIDKAALLDQLQRELTERQKLITELEKKNDELERFTYTVSHDFKAPLVTIRGFMGFLEKDLSAGKPDRIKSDLERITHATDNMQKLLEKLLNLSRAGHIIDKLEAVSFDVLVQDALKLLAGAIREKQIHIQLDQNWPVIHCDPTRLIQALQNLIDNAIKFMGEQPSPQINIGQYTDASGEPVFYVKDNGMGIAAENLSRVFGLFDKLDSRADGTGIGLATVKRIIETHGGRIWVASDGLSQGTTFSFTVPAQKAKQHGENN